VSVSSRGLSAPLRSPRPRSANVRTAQGLRRADGDLVRQRDVGGDHSGAPLRQARTGAGGSGAAAPDRPVLRQRRERQGFEGERSSPRQLQCGHTGYAGLAARAVWPAPNVYAHWVGWPRSRRPAGSGALVVKSGSSAEAPNGDASAATSVRHLSADRCQMTVRRAGAPASRARCRAAVVTSGASAETPTLPQVRRRVLTAYQADRLSMERSPGRVQAARITPAESRDAETRTRGCPGPRPSETRRSHHRPSE